MRIRLGAVLFDLDGTLVDSADDILASIAHAIRACGLAPDADPEAARPFLGFTLDSMLRMMGFRFDDERYEGILEVYAAHYMAHWKDRTRIYEGVLPMLDRLRGLPMAVVTQKRQFQADAMVEDFGLAPRFPVVVGMEKGLGPKPAPDLPLLAARRLGVEPARCAMVGDMTVDVLAAKAAGMLPVAAGWGFGREEDLAAASPGFLARNPAQAAEFMEGIRQDSVR